MDKYSESENIQTMEQMALFNDLLNGSTFLSSSSSQSDNQVAYC